MSIFRFYIEASIHVSIAIFALFQIFLLKNNLNAYLPLSAVVLFGSITGYNFVKYAPLAKLHHRSLTAFLRGIQFFSFLSFLLLVFYGAQLPIQTLLVFALGGALIFLYAIPVVVSKNLRSFSGAKIYVVALCWVLTVVIAPTVHFGLKTDWKFVMHCLQIFVLVVALIIPFDIRDLKYDTENLRTLPQVFGVKKAKIIAGILLVLFVIIEIAIQKKPESFWISGLVSFMTVSFIYNTKDTNPKYYCSFFIESIPIVYWMFVGLIA